MDARSVDTSTIAAARRVEMDRVRPVGGKSDSPADLRIAARRNGKEGGRQKPRDEDEQEVAEDGTLTEEDSAAESSQVVDPHAEGHILDAFA